nr:MAG TPA: hypothetical protein [Caudoviricetes sp.]
MKLNYTFRKSVNVCGNSLLLILMFSVETVTQQRGHAQYGQLLILCMRICFTKQ